MKQASVRQQIAYEYQRKHEDRRRAIEDRFFAFAVDMQERQAHPWTWRLRRAFRRWFA